MKLRKRWLLIVITVLLTGCGSEKYHTHPALANSPWPILHRLPDGKASTPYPGPSYEKGLKVSILTQYEGPGWVLFDSKGYIYVGRVEVFQGIHEFWKLEPGTFNELAHYEIPVSNVLSGLYSFIDREDCLWTMGDTWIARLCTDEGEFKEVFRADIAEEKPDIFSKDEAMLGIVPLRESPGFMDIVFITTGMKYGHEGDKLKLEIIGGKIGLLRIHDDFSYEVFLKVFENEIITNNIAVGKDDSIYLLTNKKMYKMRVLEDGTFITEWEFPYEPGPLTQEANCSASQTLRECILLLLYGKVKFGNGSGTTPTLIGNKEEYVGFADGDLPMKVIVLKTKNGEEIEGSGSVPFEFDTESQTENTLSAYHYKFIIDNNTPGSRGVAGYEIKGNYGSEHLERIWVNENVFAPNNVPLISGKSNLAYVYHHDLNTDTWYLTALNLENGEIVWQVETGTGIWRDSMYSPLTLDDRKTLYLSLMGGLLVVREIQ